MQVDNGAEFIGKRYQLARQLGRGGMGAVYRATDRLTGQVVALKRVAIPTEQLEFASQSTRSDTTSFRLGLAQEFRTLASLRHPHIISVLDYGFDETKQPYFTMDLLENAKILSEAGREQTIEGKVQLIVQVLQALAYLHRRGVVHRDLKPGNVLVANNVVKVLDFGLSVVHGQSDEEGNEIAGTLAYIAPEVLQGERATTAADLYAVGVMAYEMLVGRHPFDVSNMGQLVTDVLMSQPDLQPLEILIAQMKTRRDDPLQDPDTISEIDESLKKTTVVDDPEDFLPPTEASISPKDLEIDSSPEIDEDAIQTTIMPADALPGIVDKTIVDIDVPADEDKDGGVDDVTVIVELKNQPQRPISQSTEVDLSSLMLDVEIDENEARQILAQTSTPSASMIIARLMSKDPSARYEDAYDVIDDLCAAFDIPVPAESAAIRESFLQAAQFVGRTEELSHLISGLDASFHSEGSAWLIGGESGVGKSRLLDELRTRALVKGALVLSGQGVAGGGLPYQLWRDPLRRLALTTELDDLDAGILMDLVHDIDQLIGRNIPDAVSVEGEAYQQRLMETIISIFRRHEQPILLLLEDLQWMTESLEVLQLLNDMVGELPMLIVGSYRSEDRPDLPELLTNMRHMKLDRLDNDNIADLSVSMLGEVGRQAHVLELLQRETEGNVYFLVEVVRALAEEAGRLVNVGRMALPEHVFAGGIQAVMQRRLDRVPVDARELLRLAAVAGRELDLNIMRHLNEDTDLDTWLAICSNSAVLEVHDGQWHFAHDKLRMTLLDGVDESVRPNLHRRVAVAIEDVYPNEPEQATILVQHWHMAGDKSKELVYAQKAGDYDMKISAYNEAIGYYQRTLDLIPYVTLGGNPRRLEAAIHLKLGETHQYMGDFAEATKHIIQGLDIFREQKIDAGIARGLNLLGEVSWRQGNNTEAINYCEDALALGREINNSYEIARALTRLGAIHRRQGNYDDAKAEFEEALQYVDFDENREMRVSAINNLGGVAFVRGDLDTAAKYFNEALDLSRASGERRKIATTLSNLGSLSGARDDLDAARKYFTETLDIYREIGERRGVAMVIDNLGMVAFDQDDFDSARHYFLESLELSRSIGDRQAEANALTNLGEAARKTGDHDSAASYYMDALSLAHESDAVPMIMVILTGMASIESNQDRALNLLGLVLNHQATDDWTRNNAQAALKKLEESMPSEDVEAGVEKAKQIELNKLVDEILQSYTA